MFSQLRIAVFSLTFVTPYIR